MQSSWIPSLMSATRLRKIMKTPLSYKILCSFQDFPLKDMPYSASIDETEDFNIITLSLKAKAFCLFLRSLGRERTVTAAGPLYTSCAGDLATGWFWGRACEQGAGHFSWQGTVTAVGIREWEREVTAFFSIRSSQPCQFLVLLPLRQTVAAHGQDA